MQETKTWLDYFMEAYSENFIKEQNELHERLIWGVTRERSPMSESIKDYVKDQFSQLNQQHMTPSQNVGTGSPKESNLTAGCSTRINNQIKPFLMIDISAIKQQDYTLEEIAGMFEQTGISIIRRKFNMTWGEAIEALKQGKKVARMGWNGQGMFVYYVPAQSYQSVTEVAKKEFGSTTFYNDYFAIKNTDGTVSTWVPSVRDNLAQDWYVVE